MTQLFKKAACFTDIHFGNKSNSKQFNQDADRFVDWFIGQAKENNCETCIFLVTGITNVRPSMLTHFPILDIYEQFRKIIKEF